MERSGPAVKRLMHIAGGSFDAIRICPGFVATAVRGLWDTGLAVFAARGVRRGAERAGVSLKGAVGVTKT